MRIHSIALATVLVLLVGQALAQAPSNCIASSAAVTLRYESTPPLLAESPDSTTRVSVHEDGCVSIHFPAQSRFRGQHALQLAAADLDTFNHRIDDWQLLRIKPAQLRHSLASVAAHRGADANTHAVTMKLDESLIRFELPGAGKNMHSLRYPGLRQAFINHPDNAQIQAMHEAKIAVETLLQRVIQNVAVEVHP